MDIHKAIEEFETEMIDNVDRFCLPILKDILKELSLNYPLREISYVSGMGTHFIRIEPKSRNNFLYCNEFPIDWSTGNIDDDKASFLDENHPISKAINYLNNAFYPSSSGAVWLPDMVYKNGIDITE